MPISCYSDRHLDKLRNSPVSKQIIIIGAGPGGLAAAMLLANAGLDVTVLERLDDVGGRSRTYRADGFHFDAGPTFFLFPRILAEIFEQCGRNLEDEIELIRLDPHYHLVFGAGGELNATGDLERMSAEIARLSPEDAGAMERFMADNRTKMSAFEPALQSPFSSLFDFLRPPILKAAPLLRPFRTVDSDLKRFFSDPRVRLAFTFQSKYLGMSPFRCPSLFTILSYMEYAHGVFHPRGGCGAVMEAMARVARELGADIRTEEPVERILFEGRRAVGVETANGRYPADALVVNADFAQSMTRLVPDRLRRRWRDRSIARKRFSCSTFMMYLGVEGLADDVAHHTIYLSEDYERNIAEIERGLAPMDDPSFYVQNAGVTDPTLAPPGHSTLYVLAPVGNLDGGFDWAARKDAYRQVVLGQLAKIGIRDIEPRIRYEKIVTPSDWAHDLNIYRGATFNLAHSYDQMFHRRPNNRFEDLDRVYLTGGGTHPGSGLPVIFESARISTRLMAEDLGFDWLGQRSVAAARTPVDRAVLTERTV